MGFKYEAIIEVQTVLPEICEANYYRVDEMEFPNPVQEGDKINIAKDENEEFIFGGVVTLIGHYFCYGYIQDAHSTLEAPGAFSHITIKGSADPRNLSKLEEYIQKLQHR